MNRDLAEEGVTPPELDHSPNGLPRFHATGKPLTLKMIKDVESEID
jgi:hypothetical protein